MDAAKAMKARHQMTEDETAGHFKTWRIVVAQYGLKAFTRAFWQTLSVVEGFPDAASVRRILAEGDPRPVETDKRNCGKCRDGWVVAFYKAVGKGKHKVLTMRRCECKGGREVDWAEQKRMVA